jgi:hypothetical protein
VTFDRMSDELFRELIEFPGRQARAEPALHAESHLSKFTEMLLFAEAFSHASGFANDKLSDDEERARNARFGTAA